MARYLFPGDTVFEKDGDEVEIGDGVAITFWSEAEGGTDYTPDVFAPDEVTAPTLVADIDGNVGPVRGPDGVRLMWRDTGNNIRYPVYAVDELESVLDGFEALETRVTTLEAGGGGGGGGITDHGFLSGLADDDHTQYHNNARGDLRYYTKTQADANSAAAASQESANDRNRALHTGEQAIGTITNLDYRLNSVVHNTKTASHVLALADVGCLVEMNVSTPNNMTVPPNSSVAFPIGTIVNGQQYGTGLTTIVPAAGVTIRSRGNLMNSAGQYAGWSLTKRATDEWVLIGDLS